MKSSPADEIILETRGVSKRFPGVLALDGVDLKIYAGKVTAIVGENGAGKSTLMNILSGVYAEYDGEVLLEGNTSRGGKDVSMIHQELNLVPYLSIAENIFLGREPLTRLGLVDHERMRRDAASLLDRLHCDVSPDSLVSEQRVGTQQMVEIAKVLSVEAKVLIMDEPTSSLSEKETVVLFQLIRELTAKGVAVVYISHKMDEIRQLAHYVAVLRDGRLIDEMPMAETDMDSLVRMMVGRDRKDFFVKQSHPKGKTLLEVNGLQLKDPHHSGRFILDGISFSVKAGEVLGIYGLMGAGRTELFETIFGVYGKPDGGEVRVDGKKVCIDHPREAVDCGLALIPEDRKQDGLVLGMDIVENTTLASLAQFLQHGLIQESKERSLTDAYRERLHIKSFSGRQKAGNLSGGNQQKVVLSKWLLTEPKVVLLDEPTRGIDIHAKNEIYALMDELVAQGMALVVVSSELPEIMAVSDRIITLRCGRTGEEFCRESFGEEAILKAALPIE